MNAATLAHSATLPPAHAAPTPPMQELITWHEVAQEMPDSDETVLGFNAAWSEPCWGCYHDGETWRALEGERLYPANPKLAEEAHEPTHWAKWPFGPGKKGGVR